MKELRVVDKEAEYNPVFGERVNGGVWSSEILLFSALFESHISFMELVFRSMPSNQELCLSFDKIFIRYSKKEHKNKIC